MSDEVEFSDPTHDELTAGHRAQHVESVERFATLEDAQDQWRYFGSVGGLDEARWVQFLGVPRRFWLLLMNLALD